ncbi:hypothetical protein WHI96_21945 [Pseudonocardia tropica]|uniref:Uncharacterized protein n=1 Tax=Pseudonocardia tropica TaxID=681289 RepID=A0ABV1JZT0_9PSEU
MRNRLGVVACAVVACTACGPPPADLPPRIVPPATTASTSVPTPVPTGGPPGVAPPVPRTTGTPPAPTPSRAGPTVDDPAAPTTTDRPTRRPPPPTRPGGGGEPTRIAPRLGGAPPRGSIPDKLGGEYTFDAYRAELMAECAPAPTGCVTVVIDRAASPPGATGSWFACATTPTPGTHLATIVGRTVRVTVGYSSCDPIDGLPAEEPDPAAGDGGEPAPEVGGTPQDDTGHGGG